MRRKKKKKLEHIHKTHPRKRHNFQKKGILKYVQILNVYPHHHLTINDIMTAERLQERR